MGCVECREGKPAVDQSGWDRFTIRSDGSVVDAAGAELAAGTMHCCSGGKLTQAGSTVTSPGVSQRRAQRSKWLPPEKKKQVHDHGALRDGDAHLDRGGGQGPDRGTSTFVRAEAARGEGERPGGL